MIGMFGKTCKGFHLSCKKFFLIWCLVIPCWNFFWTCSKLCILWYYAQCLLFCKSFFSQFIPTLIEFSFILIYIFFGCMMRSMCGACCELHIEWFVWCNRLLRTYPINSLVGHVCCKMIIWIMWNFYPYCAIIN